MAAVCKAALERTMVTFVVERDQVDVPEWVTDLKTFRRWLEEDCVPENARIGFIDGRVWVDMSKEQLFTHVAVKTEFIVVQGSLAKHELLGRYFGDCALLIN